jgi:protein arginine kinase activator
MKFIFGRIKAKVQKRKVEKKKGMINMKCENCGKNEANVKYTQIINGEKKQMFLCEDCSERLGINDIHFNMPINFTSFLSDFFDDMNEINLIPTLGEKNMLQCSKCGLTWDNFLHTGQFGCSNCYDDFSSRIEPILRSLQGATSHIGRIGEVRSGNNVKQNLDDKVESKEVNKIDKLKEDLKNAIKEERYEDAAKIRDEIKKYEE